MPGERSISHRLVEELAGIVRVRQAYLAMRIASYGEASWQTEQRISHEQIRELLELVIEAFEGISSELQGAIEIDTALFTRGLDVLRNTDRDNNDDDA
jgi:hypothetical protein